MSDPKPILSFTPAHNAQFLTTHWSVVTAAGDGSAAALEQLCRIYWFPIYAFIRRTRRVAHHDAEELTQGFFAHLLEMETLTKASRDKGRFRTFLLGVLVKFQANEHKRQRTWKRGGRHETISLDEVMAEYLYTCNPVAASTPEQLFDREWAATLVNHVLRRLSNEYAEAGKASQFARLEPLITEPDKEGVCARFAAEFAMTEGAAKVQLHRLRRRYGELLRSEVAQTVDKAEIEDEFRHLIAVMAS